MGGQSSTSQTQSSTTNPWATATPALNGILGQVGTGLNNTGVTGAENSALNQLTSNAGQYSSQFAPQIQSYASNLLSGGGANAQAGNLQGGLDQYQQQLAPYANGSMIGNNPALQAQLGQIGTDVTNQVNGSFAGAGRDFSGANQMALARGISAGQAPVIANQYNQDVQNQLSAAGSLYGAQNQTGGLLAGLNQQGLSNQGQGVQASQDAASAQNAAPNAVLQAEAQRRGIPVQALGLLAQIGIPIAGLGSQSTGQSQGTQQASGAQQFAQIMGGLGGLFGNGGTGQGGTGSGVLGGIKKTFLGGG